VKEEPKPFVVDIPDEVLLDLDGRLAATRFPASIPGSGWSYGTDVDYLRELVGYWRTGYDWRDAERQINAVPQYHQEVLGVDLHFVHVPGNGPAPMPLLFVHGWPGSFWEVAKIIGPLTDPGSFGGDPSDAFSLVAPSLPGFGFSSDIRRPGMHPGAMGEILARLMTDVLGYPRFVAQGGDWGSTVLTRLAHANPDRIVGLHLNYSSVQPNLDGADDLTTQERDFLEAHRQWNLREGAYNAIQATKPQSLAVGLNDSPAGLAAWMIEKYRSWSDCAGDVESVFTKDDLLTEVMIYWVGGSIASASRLYFERAREAWQLAPKEIINVPTAYARFPAEIRQPPREWLMRMFRLERYTAMPRGGHFAAMETPELLVDDLRSFVRPLRGPAVQTIAGPGK
jgi:pimeloyl-ACP methyl ester carboxylesterase